MVEELIMTSCCNCTTSCMLRIRRAVLATAWCRQQHLMSSNYVAMLPGRKTRTRRS